MFGSLSNSSCVIFFACLKPPWRPSWPDIGRLLTSGSFRLKRRNASAYAVVRERQNHFRLKSRPSKFAIAILSEGRKVTAGTLSPHKPIRLRSFDSNVIARNTAARNFHRAVICEGDELFRVKGHGLLPNTTCEPQASYRQIVGPNQPNGERRVATHTGFAACFFANLCCGFFRTGRRQRAGVRCLQFSQCFAQLGRGNSHRRRR
jgi:hypothetical protein